MPVVMDDLLRTELTATAQAAPDYNEDQDEQAEPQKPVGEEGEQGNETSPDTNPPQSLWHCAGASTESEDH